MVVYRSDIGIVSWSHSYDTESCEDRLRNLWTYASYHYHRLSTMTR